MATMYIIMVCIYNTKMPIVPCFNCRKEVYKRPSRIKATKHVFCSQACFFYAEAKRYPEGDCVCKACGVEFRTNPAYVRRTPGRNRFCSVPCFTEYIGRIRPSDNLDSHGYRPMRGSVGRRLREHRYIMEQHLGRRLDRKEHVHHVDGDKTNNSLSNLQVLSESDHHKLHGRPLAQGSVRSTCMICGSKKILSYSYIKQKYGGDASKAARYRCKACGGGGRRKNT